MTWDTDNRTSGQPSRKWTRWAFSSFLAVLALILIAGCKAGDPKITKLKKPSNNLPSAGALAPNNKANLGLGYTAAPITLGAYKFRVVVGYNDVGDAATLGSKKVLPTVPGVAR
jgi:hypothetical protein